MHRGGGRMRARRARASASKRRLLMPVIAYVFGTRGRNRARAERQAFLSGANAAFIRMGAKRLSSTCDLHAYGPFAIARRSAPHGH